MQDRYGILTAGDVNAAIRDHSVYPIDLRPAEAYKTGHLPNSVALDYSTLVERRGPILGLMPSPEHLCTVLSRAGLSTEHDVLAYDDEGGGRACRLLWTLDVLGHRGRLLLLDGGYSAWKATGAIPEQTASNPTASTYVSTFHTERLATVDTLRGSLNDARCHLLDTRSAGEFQGSVVRAQRGGHIPGAVNIDWTEAMMANRLLKSRAALTEIYAAKGITPDHEIVTYCHSHHRSAHTYFVLKWLGFPKVRGYAGSWSEWGNRNDTPVA